MERLYGIQSVKSFLKSGEPGVQYGKEQRLKMQYVYSVYNLNPAGCRPSINAIYFCFGLSRGLLAIFAVPGVAVPRALIPLN